MQDIRDIIDETFSAMCKEYDEIFKEFYPGLESAGFNESNLVQNYDRSNGELVWVAVVGMLG